MDQVQLSCTLNKSNLPVLRTQQLVYAYLEIKATEGMVDVVKSAVPDRFKNILSGS